ncbi:MAG: pyridoxal phosphate-dependent aminotransferase family protein [Candidatus Kapabacteria bacterium]|nr:pyridoxal phosphate-dependent aminotransferase family protein [Candidatus Kapabacteria bacterium]MCS7169098.1 pyridoxal phosphate-dependent aminotransferase family protein [Candidatus Kapabacteria bacterium]MDW7997814.1 pyridoxal phosphate-dependent aminotransferase family protein [Bacteroidota bacterium]MDW8224937.1 pyridoxal phosphate-dependent aminotransferase family protein [Bacteroidota bacterium]
MDLFERCFAFTRADEVKALGLYPYFHPIEENEGPVVSIGGRKFIMAGSNNYLGLTTHPKVKEAAMAAIRKYGTGCSGSRYLTGTLDLHVELEERLARFLGYESVLLFSTGFQTALGTIAGLVQKGDYVISDRENHASIVAGALMAKGMGAEFVRYRHNDMEDLERVLARVPESAGKLVVSDGVFSVTGEIVELPRLVEIARRYNARVLVDDAHAIGVIGVGGRGTASMFGLIQETDLTMGTFSKTFASLGGFVAGPERVINYLKHHSSAIIFSASPTPASCAAALAALDILEQQPQLVDRLIRNASKMRQGFKGLGFHTLDGQTAIVPVIVGDVQTALLFWRKLFDAGVYVNAFIPPGVPPNMSMMRTSYMATHEEEHLDRILEVFEHVGRELGLLTPEARERIAAGIVQDRLSHVPASEHRAQ